MRIRAGSAIISSITRLKYHLAKLTQRDVRPCVAVSDLVQQQAQEAVLELEGCKKPRLSCAEHRGKGSSSSTASASASQPSGGSMVKPCLGTGAGLFGQIKTQTLLKEKEVIDLTIAKFVFSSNILFQCLEISRIYGGCEAISTHSPDYFPPSSETLRTKLFSSLKGGATLFVEAVKKSWALCGCTILSDSYTDGRKRPHINLLASSPKGKVFLKSECTVENKKDASYIANFITSGIEEIGAENVVQFISDNATNYTSAEGFGGICGVLRFHISKSWLSNYLANRVVHRHMKEIGVLLMLPIPRKGTD